MNPVQTEPLPEQVKRLALLLTGVDDALKDARAAAERIGVESVANRLALLELQLQGTVKTLWEETNQ